MPTAEYMRTYRKEHPLTPEQKAKSKVYWQSPAGKEAKKRYLQSIHGRRKHHNWWLKKNYGITLEDKEEMYNKQQGLCALCQQVLPDVIESCYDHNHTTGIGRGLLHHTCNTLIGLFENLPGAQEKIVSYLAFDKNPIGPS